MDANYKTPLLYWLSSTFMKDVFVNLRHLYDIIERYNKRGAGRKPSAFKCGVQEEKKSKARQNISKMFTIFSDIISN